MCASVPSSLVESNAKDTSRTIWLENDAQFNGLTVPGCIGRPWRRTCLPDGEARATACNRLRRRCANLDRIRGLVLAILCGDDVVVSYAVRQPGVDILC